ncbi:MAG: acyl-[Lachnospiraceae bacterium]|nr:acyl-[acyl-carrier-protein] thioesterase [Lachnospiraceae bacterium]
IRYSECDGKNKLSIEALLNYFQDASTMQSEDLGVGFDYLMPRNLVWVLASWQIEIKRYPVLNERVVIGTLPHDFKGFLGSRNFVMKTREGEVLAVANTLWTLLNFDTMKPTTPPPDMLEKYPVEPRLEMDYGRRKIVVGPDGEKQEPIVVRKQHLDSNNHVNNAQYVSIAGDYLPEDFEIGGLRVEYKRQAHLNDVLVPYVVQDGDTIVVSLRDEEDVVFVNTEFTAL